MEKLIKGNISLEKDTDDSNQEDISEMEEDEEEPQFLDMDEMERISSGGHHFRWIITSSKKGRPTKQHKLAHESFWFLVRFNSFCESNLNSRDKPIAFRHKMHGLSET